MRTKYVRIYYSEQADSTINIKLLTYINEAYCLIK